MLIIKIWQKYSYVRPCQIYLEHINGNQNIHHNGVLITATTTADVHDVNALEVSIGAVDGGTGDIDADYAEVILWNSYLTDLQLNRVEAYLMSKYSLE